MTTDPEQLLKVTSSEDAVTFAVHVQPRASRTGLKGLHDGELKIHLTSPPVDDAANRLCIEYLAKKLGVAKSRVTIVSGTKSRHKTIRVEGVTVDAVVSLVR